MQADPFGALAPVDSGVDIQGLISRRKRREEQELQAEQLRADLEAFGQYEGRAKRSSELTGMAGLRAAEQKMADESTIYDPEESTAFLDNYESGLVEAETSLVRERAAFDEYLKTADLTQSSERIKVKAAMRAFKGSINQLNSARKALAEGRGKVEKDRAEIELRKMNLGDIAQDADIEVEGEDTGGVLDTILGVLSAPQEVMAGVGSLAAEGLDRGLDAVGLGDEVMTPEQKVEVSPWEVLGTFGTGPVGGLYQAMDQDSDLRRRGRAFNESVGENLAMVESDPIEYGDGKTFRFGIPDATSLPRNFWKAVGVIEEEDSKGYEELAKQIQFEIATDPLNLIDVGAGSVSKLGKLRQVAKVNRKSAETLAKVRTLEAMPEVAGALGAKALSGTDEGIMVALRGAKAEDGTRLFTNEQAVNMAADFDDLFVKNLDEVNALAGSDGAAFVEAAQGALQGAESMGMGVEAANAQRRALDEYMTLSGKIGESSLYGASLKNADEINPILGTTIQEQARMNQRLAPMENVGKGLDWIRGTKGAKWVSKVVGNGIKADIPVDDLGWYYQQKAAAATQSADVMRASYESTEELASKLNGLTPERQAEVLEAVPSLVESGTISDAVKLTDDEIKIAQDVAGIYADQQDFMLHVQNRYGKDLHSLVDDFDYYQRQFSPEVRTWLAKNPTAKKQWDTWKSGQIVKASEEGFTKQRKLKGMDFFEAEAKLREVMGLPDDIPIWERNAAKVIQGRMFGASQRAEKAVWSQAFAERFGQVVDEGIEQTVQDIAGLDKADAIAKAIRKSGDRMTALKMMHDLKVAVPDDIAEIARLANTFISDSDMKTVLTMADGLWAGRKGDDLLNKIASGYDKIKQVYQRAVLARFPSLAKDMIGTASNAVMSGAVTELDEALKLVGGLKKWQRGSKFKDSRLARLQAEGVLQTTKGEALDNIGVLEKGAAGSKGGIRANIAESGVIGGTLRSLGLKKAGTKVGDTLGQLNEARVWWEEVMRVAEYLRATKKGLNHSDAVHEVYKWWGNFSELSKLERTVLNRMLFFFSWQKRAIPIAARHLFYHPARSRMMMMLMAGDAQGNEEMPEWLRRQGGHILGVDDNGNYNAMSLGGGSYMSPAFDLAESGSIQKASEGDIGGAAAAGGEWFMRAAPPFVSGAMEAAQQRDFFTGKPWYNPHTKQSQVKAPAVLSWLGEDSALGKFLEIKKHVDPDDPNRITHFTMDPEVASTLGFIPGFDPAIQDVSSFADPRASDLGPLSLKKGASRAVGLPVYTFQKFDDADKLKFEYGKFFDALGEEVARTPSLGLRYANESVVIDTKSEKGQEMAYDLKRWTAEHGEKVAQKKFDAKYDRQSTLIALAKKVRQIEAAKLRELETGQTKNPFTGLDALKYQEPSVPTLEGLMQPQE